MKNLIFWAFTKNKYRGRHCLKNGGLGQFADLKGGTWQGRGGGVFEGGYPDAHWYKRSPHKKRKSPNLFNTYVKFTDFIPKVIKLKSGTVLNSTKYQLLPKKDRRNIFPQANTFIARIMECKYLFMWKSNEAIEYNQNCFRFITIVNLPYKPASMFRCNNALVNLWVILQSD